MSVLSIPTAEVFEPLLAPARDKAAFGGRGSGKSHFFAGKLVEDSITEPGDHGAGLLSVCIREVQKDLAQSSKRLIEAKLAEHGLGEADGFKVFKDVIQTPGDGIVIFKGMNDYTADSIKSLEGFKRGWWEEAHGATETSIGLYRPTLRADGAERWWSWNPRFKRDPVDVMFRGEERPTGAVVVNASWRHNPWFTEELETERQDTLRLKPDSYDNVWEGGYVKVVEGAYFAKELAQAKADGRISFVARDPNLQVRTFWDLGRRDHTAIWVAQFSGQRINVIDHIEGSGQSPGHYFEDLRQRGYKGCMVYLPHDGSRVGPENSSGRSYEDQAKDAGFDVQVILNQGQGAAMLRIDAARRLFPRIWFDETKAEGGLEALGAYHERKDEKRDIGLGPEHDWASHSADAFGLMCVAYEEPKIKTAKKTPAPVGGWMGR